MKQKYLTSAIASEDYRKYITENGIVLSDWELATLIYNNQQLHFDERMEALQSVAKEIGEEALRTQIDECISRIQSFLRGFRENNGNSYYQLSTWDKDEYEMEGIYLDFDSAYFFKAR